MSVEELRGLSSHSSPAAAILCALSKGLQAPEAIVPRTGIAKVTPLQGIWLSTLQALSASHHVVPLTLASGTLI